MSKRNNNTYLKEVFCYIISLDENLKAKPTNVGTHKNIEYRIHVNGAIRAYSKNTGLVMSLGFPITMKTILSSNERFAICKEGVITAIYLRKFKGIENPKELNLGVGRFAYQLQVGGPKLKCTTCYRRV